MCVYLRPCVFTLFTTCRASVVSGKVTRKVTPRRWDRAFCVREAKRSDEKFLSIMENRSLCCVSVSFSARIIGAYTMSTSILLINVLVSNFFSRNGDEDFFESVKSWAMLGVNWMQAMRYTQLQRKAQAALICFLIYAISFLLASAYLSLGSMSRRHMSAVPWMYLQMISVIDQTVALCSHIINDQQTSLYLWYTTICSIYLILSVYFWMIVEAARNQWKEEQNRIANCELIVMDFVSTPSRDQKSPSFLAPNFSMFESPRPPTILPK